METYNRIFAQALTLPVGLRIKLIDEIQYNTERKQCSNCYFSFDNSYDIDKFECNTCDMRDYRNWQTKETQFTLNSCLEN